MYLPTKLNKNNLLFLSMFIFCTFIFAKSNTLSKTNNNYPLTIKSEKIYINLQKHIYTYSHHVYAEYGKNQLTCSLLKIQMNKSTINKTQAIGNPANLKIIDKKNKTTIYAHANKIESYPNLHKLLLLKSASINKNGQHLTAEKIILNTKNYNISAISSSPHLSTIVLQKK